MSKLVVFMNLTLDGVMQAPGRPDEDPGGFQHGGWAYVQVRSPDTDQDRRTITADRSWMRGTAIGIGGIWVAVLLLSLLAPDLVPGSEQQHFPVAAAMLTTLAGGAGLSGGRVGAGGWAGRPRPSGGVACRAGAAERDQGDSQGDGQPGPASTALALALGLVR